LAIATAFIASTSIPGIAAAQQADRVWALDCTLGNDTVDGLEQDMAAAGGNRLGTPTVAFVVIYSFQGNDGQPLSGVTDPEGPHTGPVICRAPGVNINQVLQTADIPTTNVLDVENAIILRYGTTSVEKRYCHTVDANSDCFRLR
jgi:hypothetical protein